MKIILEIIEFENKILWDNIVKSFKNYDVYYLHNYVSLYIGIGDGIPLLIYFHNKYFRLCYVVQKLDISFNDKFKNYIPSNKYFDISTPYGYGGPIYEGNLNDNVKKFFLELNEYCNGNSIITQFIRFNPLLQNQNIFLNYADVIKLKQTVKIVTSDKTKILLNLTSKNRNMVKKAIKNKVNVYIDNSQNSINKFIELYNDTMQRNCANNYYYFNKSYFIDMISGLKENCNLFIAKYENITICAAIILYANNYMHYHLSASDKEFMNLAPNNLLLYEVANWGSVNGFCEFHLGGGNMPEDSLFKFKKSFNKKGLLDFYIGRNIFNNKIFEYLIDIRKKFDKTFNENNNFLIKYRG